MAQKSLSIRQKTNEELLDEYFKLKQSPFWVRHHPGVKEKLEKYEKELGLAVIANAACELLQKQLEDSIYELKCHTDEKFERMESFVAGMAAILVTIGFIWGLFSFTFWFVS